VDVELQRHRHPRREHVDRGQPGGVVDPRRQDRRAQVGGAGHPHLGDDRGLAVDGVAGPLDREAELGQDVARRRHDPNVS
jgi:hypothetical protein